jgi:hypothetical protein
MSTPVIATSPEEAAIIDEAMLLARLPISRRTLFKWRNSGGMPHIRVPGSRRVLYHWDSVQAWLFAQQRGGLQ